MTDRTVVYRLQADVGNLKAQMTAAGASVKKAADDMTAATKEGAKFRQGLDTLGGTAGRVGLVAAAGLGAAVKAAVDWESAWAGVEKTVDGSASQMAKLEGELRGLAQTMPATHQEIAATAEAAGQLGVAREDVASFTRTMLMLGETTNLTADEAATSIAQMANIMGTSGEDIDNLGSALVAVGNAGASTEAQIIQMAQGIAGAANVVGMSEAEVLGIANAVASVGIEVEAGSSSVSRVLTDMGKATAQGGEKLELFARTAGVSAEDFAGAFEDRPAEALTMFIEGLGQIQASGGDVFTTLDQLGMSDVRVSRALLGMAADSEKFAGSLDLASSAWEENSALTDEFAKRLGTTAAEVQIAWNNIKDAGIEAGSALLPVVSQIADSVASIGQAFGSLPGPVKGAATSLAGVTAVLGGGLWFSAKIVSGIASTRGALADIGLTSKSTKGDLEGVATASQKAGSRLATIGRTALGIAAVGMAVGSLADNVGRIDTQNLDRSLSALGRGEMTDEIKTVIEDLEYLSSWDNSIDLGEVVTAGGLFGDSTMDKMADNIDQIDQALAGLVETGERAAAEELFEKITAEAADAGVSTDKVKDSFDAYALALRNSSEPAEAAADTNNRFATATATAGDAASMTAEEVQELADAMREQYDAAVAGFDAQTQWGNAVAAARAAAKGGSGGINAMTKAGRENRAVLSDLAGAWNNQSDAVKNTAGRFSAAKGEFIRTATAMGVPKKAARDLANELMSIPPKRVTDVQVNTAGANANLDAFWTRWNAIRSKSVYLTTITRQVGPAAKAGPGVATGGHIRGPGTATSDSIPAMLSDGEFVMRAAAVERYGLDTMFKMNAMRLADGGSTDKERNRKAREYRRDVRGATREFNIGDLGMRETRQELRAFAKDIRQAGGKLGKSFDNLGERALKVSRKYEKQEQIFERSQSRAADLRSAGRGAFDNDPFGNGLAGFDLQVAADRNDSKTMAATLWHLRRKGLNGPLYEALASSGDINTAQQLLASGRGGIRSREAAFASRTSAQAGLGNQAAVFAAAAQDRAAKAMERHTRRLERHEKKMEGLIYRGTKAGAAAGIEGRDKRKNRETSGRKKAGR